MIIGLCIWVAGGIVWLWNQFMKLRAWTLEGRLARLNKRIRSREAYLEKLSFAVVSMWLARKLWENNNK